MKKQARRLVLLAAVFLTVVNVFSQSFVDYSPTIDVARQELSQRSLDRLEGIWQFSTDGAVIKIVKERPVSKTSPTVLSYVMSILESPNRTIMPRTEMGYITATAKSDTYEARIFTHARHVPARLTSPKRFVVTLKGDRLIISPVKASLSFNLLRMIPYAYRVGLVYRDNRPKDLDGCIRLFPVNSKPQQIVYL